MLHRWLFISAIVLPFMVFPVAFLNSGTLSITLNTNDWEMNKVPVNGLSDTWQITNGYFCLSNNGDVTAEISISVSTSSPDGWLPGNESGINRFRMGVCPKPEHPWPRFNTIPPEGALLTNRLSTNGCMHFDLQFHAPTSAERLDIPQTIDITITASEAP